MAHTFCPLPWKHVSTQANGDLRVCCQCTTSPFGKAVRPDGEFYNAARDEADEARNADVFKEIRRGMLRGERPEACRLCWQEEGLGKVSRRQYELGASGGALEERALRLTRADGVIDPADFPVTNFDLRLGNHCNLKCRSCGPRDSSSWYADYGEMHQGLSGGVPPDVDGRYKLARGEGGGWSLATRDYAWHEDSALLRQLERGIGHVEKIYFTGGEPTLIPAHWGLLDKIIASGHAGRIQLDYSTNASALRDEHLETWSHFKAVFLGCSVDAVEEKAAYLRPPVGWDTVERNLLKISSAGGNLRGAFSVTVSVYNVLHYPYILLRLWDLGLGNFDPVPQGQVLEDPYWMSVQILPSRAKKVVEERYEAFLGTVAERLPHAQVERVRAKLQYIVSHMNLRDLSENIPLFYRMTERLDRIRNQSFHRVFPETHRLLQMRTGWAQIASASTGGAGSKAV